MMIHTIITAKHVVMHQSIRLGAQTKRSAQQKDAIVHTMQKAYASAITIRN